MLTVLVTGGAGYIGSVVVEQLVEIGYKVVIIDDLRDGNKESIPDSVEFFNNNFGDKKILSEIFSNFGIDVVMHFAAYASVPLSVTMPQDYYQNNVINSINLLNMMIKFNVKKIIFSSTAAVYGEPKYIPIDEKHSLSPINPYGFSKLIIENILNDYHRAYGLKNIALRYFCAAGATEKNGESRITKESHIVPLIIDSIINSKQQLHVFGTDYNTKDGSCIRDFIHVSDISSAHIMALEKLDIYQNNTYNIGTNHGYTVLELIDKAETIHSAKVNYSISERRPGDPSSLVASYEKIKNDLGWRPKFNLEDILISTMNWRKYPNY